jgi:hypothetical protein
MTTKRKRRPGTSSKEMREARIRTSGNPQVRAAFEAGEITCYRAGEISRLPVHEQEPVLEPVLAQWTNRSLCRTQGQRIAAEVIRKALRRSKVDLGEIACAIRTEILSTPLR